jgi:hypothetical protein
VAEQEEEQEDSTHPLTMSRRTSLDTTDFDANYGDMRQLQFWEEEEEGEGRARQQDILPGIFTYLPILTYLSSLNFL